MRKYLSILIAMAISCALGSCSKGKDQPQPQVSMHTAAIIGKVASGAPAGLSLSITDPSIGKILTVRPDASGNFRFSSLPGAIYGISLDVPGMATMSSVIKVELPAAATLDIGTLNFSGNTFTYLTGTGSIIGKISPAVAGSGIWAYREESMVSYQGTIDAGGNFAIPALPYGTYSLNVSPVNGYTILDGQDLKLTLTTGKIADRGNILFSDNSSPSSPNYIYFEIDGVATTRGRQVSASYANGTLSLSSFTNGTQNNALGEIKVALYSKMELVLNNVTGTGTYACNGTGSLIRYSWRQPSPFSATPLNLWSTTGNGGSGTVTIERIDVANRTISGSFSATLVPENATATGNRSVASGKFANFKY